MILDEKLKELIERKEPSCVQNDCKKELNKDDLSKKIAIENYNKWIVN